MAHHHVRLRKALKGHGLRLVPIDGWWGRGRPPSTGGFNPVGVLCHHTGSATGGKSYAEWMARVGRSDLPAPLCQIGLDKDGTVYLCASGRANHAGTAKASGPIAAGDGNAMYIGIEAMNSGSEGWSKKQYDAYVTVCAALCLHFGWKAARVRAHKETSTTGKWDPGMLDMHKFRRDVGAEIHRMRQPKIRRWGPVNVWRVNRGLRGGRLDRVTKKQMNRIVWALRAQQGPAAATGYKKHPRASLRRALKKFRIGKTEGMFSKGAGKRLKHLKGVFNKKLK